MRTAHRLAGITAALVMAACQSGAPVSSSFGSPQPIGQASGLASLPPATSSALTGDVPGPGASVPPGVPVIPGLGIQALAGLWGPLGLSCQSRAGGIAGSPGGYNIHCEGTDQAGFADVVAEAVYWTPEGVQTMSTAITPATEQALDGPAAADRWLLPFASLVGGDEARTWVQDRIGDAACGGGCTRAVPGGNLSYYSGSRGAQELFLVATSAP